ncbi:MAG: ZIP family metal transporter [Erysipelotrichales bacterium]|nr:ZIP family metal transporter [Erysipelotrichales bacterium]
MELSWQVILGIFFPFLMTSLGASAVFLFKNKISQSVQSIFLGFAAGVMIAASIFSLLLPAMEEADALGKSGITIASIGFLVGALFLTVLDLFMPHLHLNTDEPEGVKTSWDKTILLMLAVTLHNVPEGMAVGLTFALAMQHGDPLSLAAAFALALGMGIQNFPEGAAISLPLKSQGMSNQKSFLWGSLSGAVEPIFAFLALFIANVLSNWMPFLLSFSAGAMMFVTVEELIPEAQTQSHSHYATYGILIGFVLMMVFDVVLG